MISKVEIKNNLNEILSLYNGARGRKKPQYYAKLAIIEASGWIEMCIDEIVLNISNSKLTITANKASFINEVVDKTSGFEYNKYVRNKLLRNLIGIVLTEKIEVVLSSNSDFIQMQSSLKTLSNHRNANAHEYISGTTPSLISPSVTIQLFDEIYKGLTVLNKEIKKVKFK